MMMMMMLMIMRYTAVQLRYLAERSNYDGHMQ